MWCLVLASHHCNPRPDASERSRRLSLFEVRLMGLRRYGTEFGDGKWHSVNGVTEKGILYMGV